MISSVLIKTSGRNDTEWNKNLKTSEKNHKKRTPSLFI